MIVTQVGGEMALLALTTKSTSSCLLKLLKRDWAFGAQNVLSLSSRSLV